MGKKRPRAFAPADSGNQPEKTFLIRPFSVLKMPFKAHCRIYYTFILIFFTLTVL
jgi:hypothetical protein